MVKGSNCQYVRTYVQLHFLQLSHVGKVPRTLDLIWILAVCTIVAY